MHHFGPNLNPKAAKGRHNGGNHNASNVVLGKPSQLEKAAQAYSQFVGGFLRIRFNAPHMLKFGTFVNAQNGVRIAYVYCK